MVDYQSLLDQAALPSAPAMPGSEGAVLNNPYTQKRAELAITSAEKKAELLTNSPTAGIPDMYSIAAGMGVQNGANSMSEMESDLRTLNPLQLYNKYGAAGLELNDARAAAGTDFFNDQLGYGRTPGEVLTDTAGGIGGGFVGSLGGLAALGLGVINDDAGAWASGKLSEGMQWLESTQSEDLNAARRVQRARSNLDMRDNAQLREEEMRLGRGELSADIRRWGRDTWDTLVNSAEDPTMLMQGTAEAGGSLLAGGPVSKGLKAIGAPILKMAGRVAPNAAARAGAVGERAAWPLATAGLEGGGAYSGATNNVMEMSFEELEANSPAYREAIASGLTPEDARIQVANRTGLLAAAIQAPIAAGAGTLTRFAETPFRVPSVGTAARNVLLNEPLEEAIQGTTGQLSQNLAVQALADENQVLSEGLGQQTAQGALYGSLAAGTVQGPGAAVQAGKDAGQLVYRGARTAVQAAVDAGKPLFTALVERGDRLIRQHEKASPVSDDIMQERAATNVASAPVDAAAVQEAVRNSGATPEQQAEIDTYVSSLVQAMQFDMASPDMVDLPETHRAVLDGATNRVDAIQRMAREVARLPEGPEQLEAAATMWYLLEPMNALQESDPTALDSIAMSNPEVNSILSQYESVIADIGNTASVKRALRSINELMSKAQVEQNIQPVSEESLGTVEGQQNVRNAVAVASLHPDKGNVEAIEQILTHAANGRLNLTTQQWNSLRVSRELLRARKNLEAEIAAKGLRSAKDVVSSQVVAGNDPLRKIAKSALQHTMGILSAMRGNNSELGQARLEDFGKFVQHMQNKVDALNTHFNNGDPSAPGVVYEALQPNAERNFKPSRDGMYVNTRSPKSIDQAQSIALEAQILGDVYNGLVDTFGLNQPKIQISSLAPALQGNPEELAKQFRTGAAANVEEVNTPAVQPSGTTEVEAEPVSSGTETESEEARPRAELSEETVNEPAEPEVVDEVSTPSPVQLVESEVGGVSSIKAFVDGQEVGELLYTVDGSMEQSVEVAEGFRRRGIATAMYDLARQRGASLENARNQSDEGRAFRQAFDQRQAATEAVVEEQSEPTGIESAYPNLYQGVPNKLIESFDLPTEPRTRLYSEESPVQSVARALSSDMRLRSFALEGDVRNTLTDAASDVYQELLGEVLPKVLRHVNENLQSFLDRPYSKSDKTTIAQKIISGTEANRWRNGKVLNLVEQDGDTFKYQNQLLEQAGLATMQWMLSANQFSSQLDAGDVADITGIEEHLLTRDMIEAVTAGMSHEQAVRSLGQKIANYWGLQAKRDADIAYTDGIPQAMAAEMLRGLIAADLMEVTTVEIREGENGATENRTIKRYNPLRPNEESAVHTFPDAIETAVLIQPEHTNYFGDEVPPVAQRQMNNPEVDNTPAQRDALTKEQQTPFYVSRQMASFFTNMGKDALLSLFGTNLDNEELWNVNDYKSLDGKNRGIVAAFNHMQEVIADLSNHAAASSQELDQVPVRYAYNMSRVGRMQMLGKYNPQANKLMREVFLPTRSTLDLSTQDGDAWDAYTLGLGQMLGIKIHNLPLETSQMKLGQMLNGGLAPAVAMLREWLNRADLDNPLNAELGFTAEEINTLRDGFKAAGADLSFMGLHALVDWARYLNTSDRSAYTTSVYVEADGVTNGPINAMALMTIGDFSSSWIENIRKGGLTFGAAQPLSDIRLTDSKDLYQAGTDAFRERLSDLRDQLQDQKWQPDVAMEMLDHTLSLMDILLPEVSYDPNKSWDDGALEMTRGIMKNPLTITIYGSGAPGIAGKVMEALTSKIYGLMSQVLKRPEGVSVADAMFPGDVNAADKLARMSDAINALTKNEVKRVRGELQFETVANPARTTDPKNFTFKPDELQNMQRNLLELFVNPMRQGIEDTVGYGLMKGVGLLRDAAQVQSIIYQYEFKRAVDAALTNKRENDPNWKPGEFMSQAEFMEIKKSLDGIAPLVQTGEQTFMIASNEQVEVRGNDLKISAALDDTMDTSPNIYAPGQAGVRAIPMLTIGMGDGMMMQLLAQSGLQGTLKIFDGMNMPLDKIKQYGLKSNEAVYESWKGNPMREVLKSFNRFMSNLDDSTINDETYDALVRTLFTSQEISDSKKSKTRFSVAQIKERIQSIQANLEWSAKSVDARHKAMQSMPMSVDQMAATSTPFFNNKPLVDANAIERELSTRYMANMQDAPEVEASVAPVAVEVSTKPSADVEKVGRVHSTGARVLSWTALTNLSKQGGMTEAQKLIFDEIRRSLAARDYKVVTGSVEQLDAYIEQKGLDPRPNQEVFGWTNIGDKTIFMVNPTMETLVHELVHASSYESVLAHYNGETVDPEVAAAIGRLEGMMEQFLSMEEQTMDPSTRSAYDSARQAILSANIEGDQAVAQAKALNEFMAWALTNEQLTKNLKKVSPLMQLAKDVIKAIKTLIWGRKIAPKAADDFLSNLQFNSGVIIRSQPNLAKVVRDGELFHSAAYGTNDRLNQVRRAFGTKIADLLKSEKYQKDRKLRQVEVSDSVVAAIDVALSFNAHGFGMTMQESATFRMIVSALATEADIDPNALAGAQELYTHVVKNLKVEDFMADPESLDPAMRYYAQEKFDAVMGRYLTRNDWKGRTSLMPSFLALAVVSDEFRAILNKMPLPTKLKNKEGTLDAFLENTGNTVMDSLSKRLSGQGQSKDVLNAIDNLVEQIQKVAKDEQSFLDQYASKAGGIVDRMNAALVDGMSKLSDVAMEKATDVEKNSKSAINRNLARMTKLLASVVSEKNGAIVAEQTMVMLNKANVWEPFHTLVNDLVGRTQSNALIYDLIKVTRSMVQQVRQQFREETPRIIMSKFKQEMTDEQWTTMYNALGRTDLAVLRSTMSHEEVANLFTDQNALDTAINNLEAAIQANDPKHWGLIQTKARQLANYMMTGVPGKNLLRNAHTVANLFGETVGRGFKPASGEIVDSLDQLITLYAVERLSTSDRASMASLVPSEAEGLSFTLDYLVGQRKEERAKSASGLAQINAYKGFIPSEPSQGMNLTVADDANFLELKERGYIRVANYEGSSTERLSVKRGYYYSPLSGRPVFNQGIMQNVRHTAGGVDSTSGFTVAQVAGRVTDLHRVRRLASLMKYETNDAEALMPIYNQYGQVVALERPVSSIQMEQLKPSRHLPRMIGVWRGRQAEEGMSQIYNEKLIDNLRKMYDEDMKVSKSNQKMYVNLMDSKSLDSVRKDAVNLFTDQTLDYIRQVFGDEFWVRKDMLDDAIGYRSASVGDLWSGNTRWNENAQHVMKSALVGAFGINAYRYMVKGEQIIQNFMADARTLIVVKSVVVPALNFTSNIYQLISRGVPMLSIARGIPRKLGEIDSYAKSRLRWIDAEAELRAAEGDVRAERRLKNEIQSIEDGWKRLSIWPLIQAGEFSTIADVGMTHEDLELTSGKLGEYMERMVQKLPESVRNAGRYALITKDTALFQGLQKSVQYGDFIAKAVLFEDLTKRQGVSQTEALARITEEFVNYDRLPGRFRSYLENMGLLWFYNFKIRISKVALSTIRNNPVHALLAMSMPTPDLFGTVDLPIADSLFSKLYEGSLDFSLGPEMGLRAPFLNPWFNLVN